jgi:Tol biopolymer transport system component
MGFFHLPGSIKYHYMKKQSRLLLVMLAFLVATFNYCSDDDEVKEIYLEGEPIEGIEIFFPLALYGQDLLMPKISPDGKKLLFSATASLPEWEGLWVMDLQTQQRTLLHQEGRNGDWAPDGEWIAFNIGAQIYKIRQDGTDFIQLTFDGRNFLADWAPDGEQLVIQGTEHATIIDISGKVIQFLEGAGGMPDWKNDGNAIIGFKGYSSTSIWKKLTVFDLNLNKVTQILDAAVEEDNRRPRSSSDDSKIAFQNTKGIWVMNQDGKALKRIIPNHLTNNAYRGTIKLYSSTPSWHPDGEHIIYEHFEITRTKRYPNETHVEGVIKFYKVNVNEAVAFSNLK